MLKNLVRAALLLMAVCGLLIFVIGLEATLSGTLLLLPGLGIIVSGPFLMLFGALLIGVAVILLRALTSHRAYR